MSYDKEKKRIFITNLWIATYLLYEGLQPTATSFDGNKVTFLFCDTPKLQKHVSAFLSGITEVNLSKYIGFYQHLRNEMYREKDRDKGGNYAGRHKSKQYF